jgi:N-acetylneuraminate synthase
MKSPKIIAEIGCNHRGNLETAFELIKIASIYCAVDAVKFQKRNPRELLTAEQYNAPHPNPSHAYGKTYGEHRENLEFNLDQHRQLKAYCEELGVIYSTSVWDLTSAKEIASLNPQFIKIPSACNLNFEMLGWLADNYQGDLHISFGMTTQAEEEKVVQFFEKKNRAKSLVIYSCTSGYPVSFEDICLYEITRLKNTFDSRVKEIAFRDTILVLSADVAAMTLGARWIERHYTLESNLEGY